MQGTLSHYRILEKIGTGGMGVVYRAHDEHLECDVALKVLPPGKLADPATRKRFRKEALVLSRLTHPNIAVIHDFDTQDGVDFLIEELIPGLSLDEMLLSGPLSNRDIISFGSQMADGLAAAHDLGIVHRDLKPGNIRITPDGRLKILDFGLAYIMKPASLTEIAATETQVPQFAGTLPYMSPEQLLQDKVDTRSDIWAAGCVLYEMATGRRPFLGTGPALIDAIVHGEAPLVSKLNPNVHANVAAVIEMCLEKHPERRYHSPREIAVDLRRALSTSEKHTSRSRTRARIPALISAVALISASIAGLRFVPGLWNGKGTEVTKEAGRPVAYELYLSGLRDLERWDMPASLANAISKLDRATKADPESALGFSALCEAYWAKYRLDRDNKFLDDAEKNCRSAVALNDQLPVVYVTLSQVHNGKGEYNLALQEIHQALKLQPNNADAVLSEAAVYASLGQHEEAERTFTRAVALRPNHWGGHYELGRYYFLRRRFAEAAREFERVLEITPDNAMVFATLGGINLYEKKLADAEKNLKKSVELQPSHAAYTNLGVLYYRQKRWAESAEMTQKALQINAKDWRGWLNLGLAYEWLNREADAASAYEHQLECLKELEKIKPDDSEVQAELGLLHSRKKLRRETLMYVDAALARSPKDPGVLASVAEACEYLGERNRALELVQEALANGWTLEQIETDPGQRALIRDPRFRTIANSVTKDLDPARR